MDHRFFTILIVPDERGRSYRFSVSRAFLVSLATIAFLAAAGVLGLLHFWSESSALAVDLEKSRTDQAVAVTAHERTRLEVFRLSRRIEGLTRVLEDFRALAGVDFEPEFAAGGLVEDTDLDFENPGFYPGSSLASLGETMAEKADYWTRVLRDKIRDKQVILSCTPSMRPVQGTTTYGFRWRRDPFTGQRTFHAALDISARRGTPVVAPADGVVTSTGWRTGYGKVIEINHGYGITTRYAHLHRMEVAPGDIVRRGEPIGQVGSTGRSTGPHLHYEVLENGKQVDPERFLAGEAGARF